MVIRREGWVLPVVLAGALFWAGRCSVPDPEPVVRTVPDTASAAEWGAREAELVEAVVTLTGERDGLRGMRDDLQRRLRAVEQRRPERIVVYEAPLDLSGDTAILSVEIDGGRATVVTAEPDTAGHRPVAHERIPVRDCDDGLLIRGSVLLCDRAELGHLEVFGSLGVSGEPTAPQLLAELGASWSPSFGSTFAAEVAIRADGIIEARLRKGLRVW